MIDADALLRVVGAFILFIPGWIILVAGTSWDLVSKRWLIGALVVISAWNTCIIITMPKPHWSSIISGDLIVFIIFVVSSFVAYRFWPRQVC